MMKKVILLLAFAAMTASTGAQKVAVKNNVVYDVLATPNLGVELGLGRATTLDISGNYNPFEKNDGKMFKHWLVQPRVPLLVVRTFQRHFFGVHLLGGEYNISKVKLPFGLARDGKGTPLRRLVRRRRIQLRLPVDARAEVEAQEATFGGRIRPF